MPKKRLSAEQIVAKLQVAEVEPAKGLVIILLAGAAPLVGGSQCL